MSLLKPILTYFRKVLLIVVPVPLVIKENELLVRGVVHPLMRSKNKLKPPLVLPPPNRQDVSIMRKIYVSNDRCKRHAKRLSIPDNTYIGLAVFRNLHIIEICKKLKEDLSAEVKATPLDKNDKLVTQRAVFAFENGSPYHADIVYSSPLLKGEPNSAHMQFAKELIKKVNFYMDSDAQSDSWKEGDLQCIDEIKLEN